MTTVLEGVLLESSVLLCVLFLWTEGLSAKDIHKEMFSVYGGKNLRICHVKLLTTGWQRRGWNGSVEMAEITVKRLPCRWSRRTGKAIGPVYQCWWRIMFFFKFRISIGDIFTDSPSYIKSNKISKTVIISKVLPSSNND
jgi:hypothetical protein